MRLSMQTRREIFTEASKRYRKAGKKEKTKILDELVAHLDCNRKYLLYILARWGKTIRISLDGKSVKLTTAHGKRRKGGGRKPVYTDDFIIVLRKIWAFF